MLAYITRRLVYGIVTLLALSIVVFGLLQASGGGPLDRLRLNPRMQDLIPTLTELWGLDRPIYQQYLTWLKNYLTPQDFSANNAVPFIAVGVAIAATIAIVKLMKTHWKGAIVMGVWLAAILVAVTNMTIRFNWGVSFQGGGSVWDLVFSRAGATFRLGFTALFIALLVGIPLGIYQAVRQYSFFDQLGTVGAFLMFSTPIFVVGIALQIVLALYLEKWTGVKVFYVAGMNDPGYDQMGFWQQVKDTLQHLMLPAISIALISLAGYARFQRASMLEVLHSDYLRTAKAKGLPRRKVIVKHALRNALIPIVTLVSIDIAFIIGGAIITESIFGWPGLGSLYIRAITSVDYPLVMAIVMIIGIGIVIMNIVADVMYGVMDPRVRYE
ncbi:MAG: ABC transporter permease [Acidimicrobiia bacterium]|nr:ABC transporter permease [Acidimicrobiia bacterium]